MVQPINNKKPKLIDYGNGRTSIFDKNDLEVSKTEIKKAMQRLQELAVPLSQMSKKRVKALQADEEFIECILELEKITAKEARRRHIARIGKIFREQTEEDVRNVVKALYDLTYSVEQRGKLDTWGHRIIQQGDPVIKTFCKTYREAEPNTINQHLIHFEFAKDMGEPENMDAAAQNLETYIQQILILDNFNSKKNKKKK